MVSCIILSRTKSSSKQVSPQISLPKELTRYRGFVLFIKLQTRGWFYTLLVLSTALFNKPPFKNLIVNGLVLARLYITQKEC